MRREGKFEKKGPSRTSLAHTLPFASVLLCWWVNKWEQVELLLAIVAVVDSSNRSNDVGGCSGRDHPL